MSEIVLENVPSDLFRRIEGLAERHQVPVADEMVRLLSRAIESEGPAVEAEDPRARHAALMREMRRNRVTPPPGTPDSVEMLREDRNR